MKKLMMLLVVLTGMVLVQGCDEWDDEKPYAWNNGVNPNNIKTVAEEKQPVKITNEEKLKTGCDYLTTEISEVKWIKFERNSIYIGFNPVPSDCRTIIGAAAFNGWKAIDFGCHVYAYNATKHPYPITDGSFFAGATCRYGKTKQY